MMKEGIFLRTAGIRLAEWITGTRMVSVRALSIRKTAVLMIPTVERKSMTHQVMRGTGLTACRMVQWQRTRMYIRSHSQESGAIQPMKMVRRPANGYAMMRTDTW